MTRLTNVTVTSSKDSQFSVASSSHSSDAVFFTWIWITSSHRGSNKLVAIGYAHCDVTTPTSLQARTTNY